MTSKYANSPDKVNRGFVRGVHRRSNFAAGNAADPYLSTCKKCGYAVFNWQAHEWSNVNPLGYAHTDCDARFDNYKAKVIY